MKKKTDISKTALELIKKKKIRPIPKWEFVAKNWLLWLAVVICFLVLTLGVALSIFGLVDNVMNPYFWIGVVALFWLLSYFLFRKTKKAYRLEKWQIIILIVGVSLVSAGTIYRLGWAKEFDRSLAEKSYFYRQVAPEKINMWNRVEEGYLSGIIVAVKNKNEFSLKDFNGKTWKINGNDPVIRGQIEIKVGEEIKIIGQKIDEKSFEAKEIRPWVGSGRNKLK